MTVNYLRKDSDWSVTEKI